MNRSLLLLLVATAVGCSGEPTTSVVAEQAPATPSASTSDAGTAESAENSTSPVHVIDVRSKREWDAGHVMQAIHIPHTEIADRISEVTTDKNAKIVLYCAVGGRAGTAKSKLEELGFTNVENAGGYDDVKDRF